MSVSYKNVSVVPIFNEPGTSRVFIDGENYGLVSADDGFVSYRLFCYCEQDGIFENAAHFIWTMYFSEDWYGIIDINLDRITDLDRIAWQQEFCG